MHKHKCINSYNHVHSYIHTYIHTYIHFIIFILGMYEFMFGMCSISIPFICVTCLLSLFVIGGMYCPLLCCWGRLPPGYRDPPGPGGRHRGQDHHGKQILQQPWHITSHHIYVDLTFLLLNSQCFWMLKNVCMYVVAMAYGGCIDT